MPKEQDVAAVLRLLTDEEAQNALLPPFLRDKIAQAEAVDELPGATGPFGAGPDNPIPVNGPLGELAYLAALEREGSRQRLFYHRLGSLGPLDAFETVTADGHDWDILFFSMWHPRRSNRAPEGYAFGLGPDHAPLWWGTTGFVERFPDGVYEAVVKASSAFLGLPLAQAAMRQVLESVSFERPREHAARVAGLLPILARSGASQNLRRPNLRQGPPRGATGRGCSQAGPSRIMPRQGKPRQTGLPRGRRNPALHPFRG